MLTLALPLDLPVKAVRPCYFYCQSSEAFSSLISIVIHPRLSHHSTSVDTAERKDTPFCTALPLGNSKKAKLPSPVNWRKLAYFLKGYDPGQKYITIY